MSKRLTLTVTMVALAGVFAAPAPRAAQPLPPRAPFDQLYQDYASGDFDVITRKVASPRGLASLQAPADAGKLRKWLGKWDPVKAAFLMEFAGAEGGWAPGAAITAISEGRLYVTTRPTPLGQSAADDAFELLWHKAAMSFLEDRLFVSTEELYLDTLERRYTPAPGAKPVRFDPRFTLERGIAQEQRCWNDRSQMTTSGAIAGLPAPSMNGSGDVTIQGSAQVMDSGQLRVSGTPPLEFLTSKNCLMEGVRRYSMAANMPDIANEAFTRGAWLQFQLGAYADALKTIERASATDDAELTYWMQLFRGRILDSLTRYADAERAYRAALAVRPAAQSAGVGLALALFKLDRVPDARAAAMSARRQPPETIDPWWTYLGADARFIPRWRAELRLAITQTPK